MPPRPASISLSSSHVCHLSHSCNKQINRSGISTAVTVQLTMLLHGRESHYIQCTATSTPRRLQSYSSCICTTCVQPRHFTPIWTYSCNRDLSTRLLVLRLRGHVRWHLPRHVCTCNTTASSLHANGQEIPLPYLDRPRGCSSTHCSLLLTHTYQLSNR